MRALASVTLGISLFACGGTTPDPGSGRGSGSGALVELPPVSSGCSAGALVTFHARTTNAAVADSWTDVVVRGQTAEAKAECESMVQRELERSVPTDSTARATLVRDCAPEPLTELPALPVAAAQATVLVSPRDETLAWLLASRSPHVCLTSMTVALSTFYSRKECERVLTRVRSSSGATPAEARSRADAVLAGHVTEVQARAYDACQAEKAEKLRCATLEQERVRLGKDCRRERGGPTCEQAIKATMAWRACEEKRSPAAATCRLETRRLQVLRTQKDAPLDATRAFCRARAPGRENSQE